MSGRPFAVWTFDLGAKNSGLSVVVDPTKIANKWRTNSNLDESVEIKQEGKTSSTFYVHDFSKGANENIFIQNTKIINMRY